MKTKKSKQKPAKAKAKRTTVARKHHPKAHRKAAHHPTLHTMQHHSGNHRASLTVTREELEIALEQVAGKILHRIEDVRDIVKARVERFLKAS